MDEHVETEFKLLAQQPLEPAALDAVIRQAGFTCRAIDARHHVDVYLDDAEHSLRRAGYGLRVRDDQRNRTLTCKTSGRRDGALFVRTEVEGQWSAPSLPRTADALPVNLRDCVEPFVLDRPLVDVMRLRVDRETRRLQVDGRDVCTVMLDRVDADSGGRTGAFTEIEIEVLDDLAHCERLVAAFGERLPVRASEDDKPARAATLLGLDHAQPERPPVHPDAPTGPVVVFLLAQHFTNAARAEAGVRAGRDPAQLHALRVALRRTRSLVRAFRDAWDASTSTFLLSHLAATNRRLGRLRDLDVTIASLASGRESLPSALHAAADQLVPWLQAKRDALHAEVREWLRSATRLADSRRVGESVATIERSEFATMPLRDAVRPRIDKLVETTRRLAVALPHDLPTAPTHELRIAVKRLRYFAEEFAALLPEDVQKSLGLALRLQTDLGLVCDHEQAMRQLAEWIPTTDPTPGAGQRAAALGAFMTLHARAARSARKRALRSLAKLDRKKVWRRFELHRG